MSDKMFRKVFVVEPSHDFSALTELCEKIVMLTTGYEQVGEVEETVRYSLSEFDPGKDAVLPVGRVTACVITGMVLRELFNVPVALGTYSRDHGYRFTMYGFGGEDARTKNDDS